MTTDPDPPPTSPATTRSTSRTPASGFSARHAMVTKVRGQFADFEGHRPRRHRRPGRLQGRGDDRRRLDHHRQPRPRRPPALRRLLRRRELPDLDLPLHRRRPRRHDLDHHRRPDHQGRHQARHHRLRGDRLAPPTRSATSASASRASSPSTARTGASPGTPRSRPAACWSRRRSSSSSTSRRSRPPDPPAACPETAVGARPGHAGIFGGPVVRPGHHVHMRLPDGLTTRPLVRATPARSSR